MESSIKTRINALLHTAAASAAVAWIIAFIGVLLEQPRNALLAAALFALVVLVGAIPVALTAGLSLAIFLARNNITHPVVFSAVGAVLAMAGASLLLWGSEFMVVSVLAGGLLFGLVLMNIAVLALALLSRLQSG